ncbi:MAG: DDE-type integrase/transposase/recombinase [Thermoproteota archaeon]|nr:DDE-type integrase/transposase/recombinase [Thermoproteota archaeon]
MIIESDGCSEFIVDETVNKIGSEFIWLWISIEPTNKQILAFGKLKERNMFVAERFLSNLSQRYDKHSVSTDGVTWYLQACKFLKLDHHINSSYEKSIIERAIQYIRDRTECFDDYFSMQKKECS